MSTLVQLSSRKKVPRHGRGLMHWMKIIAAVAVLCACSSLANAEVLLFSTASRATFEEYTTAANASYNHAFVKLNTSGATKLSFTTTAPNQRVIINFSAVCSVGGPAPAAHSWLLVTVLIDPAGSVGELAAPPTDNPPPSARGGTARPSR